MSKLKDDFNEDKVEYLDTVAQLQDGDDDADDNDPNDPGDLEGDD